MPQTETTADLAGFMERLSALLEASPPTDTAPSGGVLLPPMPALDATPRTLTDIYGPEGQLLPHQARLLRARGEAGLADLMANLARALREGRLTIAAPPKPAKRLLPFVYPVV